MFSVDLESVQRSYLRVCSVHTWECAVFILESVQCSDLRVCRWLDRRVGNPHAGSQLSRLTPSTLGNIQAHSGTSLDILGTEESSVPRMSSDVPSVRITNIKDSCPQWGTFDDQCQDWGRHPWTLPLNAYPVPLGTLKAYPWPPATLKAYPLTPWDPEYLPLDPLGPEGLSLTPLDRELELRIKSRTFLGQFVLVWQNSNIELNQIGYRPPLFCDKNLAIPKVFVFLYIWYF